MQKDLSYIFNLVISFFWRFFPTGEESKEAAHQSAAEVVKVSENDAK